MSKELTSVILSSGHTHFIVVDDGVDEDPDRMAEVKVCSMFERAMSHQFYVTRGKLNELFLRLLCQHVLSLIV